MPDIYAQPYLDFTSRDFQLDNGGVLKLVVNEFGVKQTTWMRIVGRLGTYDFDPEYGGLLYETLRLSNIEAARLLAEDDIRNSVEQELDLGRVFQINTLEVISIDPRTRVNWNLKLETEFDHPVTLSS
jgi:hypothetical protein